MNKLSIERFGEILILTGTPGSGKTTVARRISELAGSRKVHLHTDDFWHFIGYGAIAPYLPEAHNQNILVMEAIAKVAETYALGGYFVIVDGIIGDWFLNNFKQISVPLHYVMLQPELTTVIARCQQRGGNALSNAEVITSIHDQLFSSNTYYGHRLPVNGLSIDDVMVSVLDFLKLGKAELNFNSSTKP